MAIYFQKSSMPWICIHLFLHLSFSYLCARVCVMVRGVINSRLPSASLPGGWCDRPWGPVRETSLPRDFHVEIRLGWRVPLLMAKAISTISNKLLSLPSHFCVPRTTSSLQTRRQSCYSTTLCIPSVMASASTIHSLGTRRSVGSTVKVQHQQERVRPIFLQAQQNITLWQER